MNAVKTLRSWSRHANCVAEHGRGPKLGIGNPVLFCLRPVSWLPCISRLLRFHQLVPCLTMMHKSPLTEFEEIFSNTFQVQGGGLKRARQDSMEDPIETTASSSSLVKGKGKGKSKKGGNSGRGRGRIMSQQMQGTQQSDHQGYGYMNPEWEPQYQPPWRQDLQAPYTQDLSYQVNTMSRLLMRHEMEPTALRADTGFVMHLGAGTRGIIRQVFQASKEYHDQKSQQPRMQLTLKQTMLMTVFRTLRDRLSQLDTDAKKDLLPGLRKLGWYHQTDDQWLYLRWSAEKESLVPEEPPRMSPHAALKAHLSSILESLEESNILYQFNTIKRLTEQTDQTLPFFIKVSLQGAKAQDLFQRLLLLCGLGCLQMIDMTLRRERLEPQKLSRQLQQGMRQW